MKTIFSIFLIMLLSGLALHGQAPEKRFVGNCSFSGFALLSDSTYRGDIVNFTDRFGDGYNLNQLAVGYEIFDGRGLVFEVDTIHAATNFTADVSVTAKVNRGFAPFGSGQAYNPTENGLIPPSSQEQAGLSPTQKARVDRHNVVIMQSLIGGRDSVYSISAVPDTSTLSPVLGDAFINATADTLGLYDGAGWVLFFGGSQSADGLTILGAGTGGDPFRVDTSLIVTITRLEDSLAEKQLLIDSLDNIVLYANMPTRLDLPSCTSTMPVVITGIVIDASISVGDNLTGAITVSGGSGLLITYIQEEGGFAYYEATGSLAAGTYAPEISYAGVTVAGFFNVVAGRPDTVTVLLPGDSILVTRVCGAEISRDTISPVPADNITGAGTTNRIPVFAGVRNIIDGYFLQAVDRVTLDAGKMLVTPGGPTAGRPTAIAGGHWYNTTTLTGQWSNGTTWFDYSPWTRTGSDIYFTGGDVGIGIASTGPKVHIRSDTDTEVLLYAANSIGQVINISGGGGIASKTSIGQLANASGSASIAIGPYTIASNTMSVAIGVETTATGLEAFSFGRYASTTGAGAYTIGKNVSNAYTNSQLIGLGEGFLTTALMVGAASNTLGMGIKGRLPQVVIRGFVDVANAWTASGAVVTTALPHGLAVGQGVKMKNAASNFTFHHVASVGGTNQFTLNTAPDASGIGWLSVAGPILEVDNGTTVTTPHFSVYSDGTVRIPTLNTATPTRIAGADADGDFSQLGLGTGVTIDAGVLNVAVPDDQTTAEVPLASPINFGGVNVTTHAQAAFEAIDERLDTAMNAQPAGQVAYGNASGDGLTSSDKNVYDGTRLNLTSTGDENWPLRIINSGGSFGDGLEFRFDNGSNTATGRNIGIIQFVPRFNSAIGNEVASISATYEGAGTDRKGAISIFSSESEGNIILGMKASGRVTTIQEAGGPSAMVGVGTGVPTSLLHVSLEGAETSTVMYPGTLEGISLGTAANGFGVGSRVLLENASGAQKAAASVETVWTDATNASEDADYVIKLMDGGSAAAEKFRIDSDGNIKPAAGIKDTSGDLGTGGQVLSSTGTGTDWIDTTPLSGSGPPGVAPRRNGDRYFDYTSAKWYSAWDNENADGTGDGLDTDDWIILN